LVSINVKSNINPMMNNIRGVFCDPLVIPSDNIRNSIVIDINTQLSNVDMPVEIETVNSNIFINENSTIFANFFNSINIESISTSVICAGIGIGLHQTIDPSLLSFKIGGGLLYGAGVLTDGEYLKRLGLSMLGVGMIISQSDNDLSNALGLASFFAVQKGEICTMSGTANVGKDGKIWTSVGGISVGNEYAGTKVFYRLVRDINHGIVIEYYSPEDRNYETMLNGTYIQKGKPVSLNAGAATKRTWAFLDLVKMLKGEHIAFRDGNGTYSFGNAEVGADSKIWTSVIGVSVGNEYSKKSIVFRLLKDINHGNVIEYYSPEDKTFERMLNGTYMQNGKPVSLNAGAATGRTWAFLDLVKMLNGGQVAFRDGNGTYTSGKTEVNIDGRIFTGFGDIYVGYRYAKQEVVYIIVEDNSNNYMMDVYLTDNDGQLTGDKISSFTVIEGKLVKTKKN